MSDILVPIENEYLKQLSTMYKEVSWAPYVHSFIETAIKWKSKGQNELTKFFSPNNSWREDGTFFGLMHFGNYDIFVFSLDDKCQSLYKGILETKKINWRKPTVLFNLHHVHYPYVMKAFCEMGLILNYCNMHDMFLLGREKAFSIHMKCPSDVYLRKLETSNAPFIDSLYKTSRHRYHDGDKFILTLIDLNGGIGLFLKENDQLVAWVMKTCLGQIGFLQTVDGYNKRGYATFLLKVVSKEIADEGFVPMGAVSQANLNSISLFQNVGFHKNETCYFLEVNK